MRRKTKNIISIIIIILLCASIVFTGYLSTKSSNSNKSDNMPNISQNGSEPPEMLNGNNQGEPPEKPDGEMNGNSNMSEPPEKPDSDNNMGTPQEMPNNNGTMEQMGGQFDNNTDNNYIYLILLGVESLTLSIIILYLLMSGFNKKSWKETFTNTDKILIYIFGVIILTGGLTLTENLVVN